MSLPALPIRAVEVAGYEKYNPATLPFLSVDIFSTLLTDKA